MTHTPPLTPTGSRPNPAPPIQFTPDRQDLPGAYLRAIEAEQQAITAATIADREARLPAIGAPARVSPLPPRSSPPADRWRDRANCLGVDPDLFHPGPWDQADRDAALE